MIQADKQLIQSQLRQSSLQLRRMELQFFTTNFESLGTTSALLASMAFAALSNNIPADSHWLASATFHTCATASFMFSMWAMCNCIFISMFGPGLALRGPEGSMHKAVEGMMEERIDVYAYFRIAIVFIHAAVISLIWCYRHAHRMGWMDGILVTGMLLFSLYKLFGFTHKIQHRFEYSQVEGRKIAGILDSELYTQKSSDKKSEIFNPDSFDQNVKARWSHHGSPHMSPREPSRGLWGMRRIVRAVDTTGDGKLDSVAIDTTGDGHLDTIKRGLAFDSNGDGQVDSVAVDTNGDGRLDTVASSLDSAEPPPMELQAMSSLGRSMHEDDMAAMIEVLQNRLQEKRQNRTTPPDGTERPSGSQGAERRASRLGRMFTAGTNTNLGRRDRGKDARQQQQQQQDFAPNAYAHAHGDRSDRADRAAALARAMHQANLTDEASGPRRRSRAETYPSELFQHELEAGNFLSVSSPGRSEVMTESEDEGVDAEGAHAKSGERAGRGRRTSGRWAKGRYAHEAHMRSFLIF